MQVPEVDAMASGHNPIRPNNPYKMRLLNLLDLHVLLMKTC